MPMTARIRSVALLVVLLSAVMAAAGPDPVAPPLTARQALGLLKAGNDRFARNASKPVFMSPQLGCGITHRGAPHFEQTKFRRSMSLDAAAPQRMT